jgi:hypothetical protein
MGTTIIDGTLAAADLKWSRRGKTLFSRLTFQRADGSEEVVNKVVAADGMAANIAVGTQGRFYIFKSMGVSGVYGVRTASGIEASEYPGDQSLIFALIAIFWLAYNVLLITSDKISILGLVLTPLGIFGWYWCRKVKGEIEGLWRDDVEGNPAAARRTVASISTS